MHVDLPYGDGAIALAVPAADVPAPPALAALDGEAIGRACESAVESPPLSARVSGAARVTVVVSDLTRAGAPSLLASLVAHLGRCGAPPGRLRVLVARGAHRSLTGAERRSLHSALPRGATVAEHDCDDASSLVPLCVTSRGNAVAVRRDLLECDVALLLAPVSFHYFAGFGGGRKLVLPGCADRASILANHRLSLVDGDPVGLHPGCRAGNLDGNPVHEDMEEAASAIAHLFAVNFFTDVEGRLVFANAGDAIASHRWACAAYAAAFRVAVGSPASVVVVSAGGAPHDVNLVQAHKSLRHASAVVEPGGTIVWVARCPEGIGSASLTRALATPRDVFTRSAFRSYDLNNQTAVSLRALTSTYRVAMVTELDGRALAPAGVARCEAIGTFVTEALERHDASRVLVVRHGSRVLPFISGSQMD